MAAGRGYGGHNSTGGGQGGPCADWVGASWWGRSVDRMARQRAGCRRQAGNGRARNRARASLNCFSQGQCWGRCKGKLQSEAARRAGEASGEGEEASSQGLGRYHRLAQTEPRRPACQVVGDHLDGQPSSVGGEAAQREMVQSDTVLEVAYRILDLGVAPMVGLQGLPGNGRN